MDNVFFVKFIIEKNLDFYYLQVLTKNVHIILLSKLYVHKKGCLNFLNYIVYETSTGFELKKLANNNIYKLK